MTDHFASSLRPLAPRARAYVVLTAVLCVVSMAAPATAATPSPLFARGYTVIPEPQKDIGFNILAAFHYQRQVRADTYESLEEAVRFLNSQS